MWRGRYLIATYVGLSLLLGQALLIPSVAVGQTSGGGSVQTPSGGGGGMEVLPGGFRRFRDSGGRPGILQRTPDSGFPSSQFIAPMAPALPSAPTTTELLPPSTPLTPSLQFQENVPRFPGTQIPQVPLLPIPPQPVPGQP